MHAVTLASTLVDVVAEVLGMHREECRGCLLHEWMRDLPLSDLDVKQSVAGGERIFKDVLREDARRAAESIRQRALAVIQGPVAGAHTLRGKCCGCLCVVRCGHGHGRPPSYVVCVCVCVCVCVQRP